MKNDMCTRIKQLYALCFSFIIQKMMEEKLRRPRINENAFKRQLLTLTKRCTVRIGSLLKYINIMRYLIDNFN